MTEKLGPPKRRGPQTPEARAQLSASLRRFLATEEGAAQQREMNRRRWERDPRRLPPMSADEKRQYIKLRVILGPDKARAEMNMIVGRND